MSEAKTGYMAELDAWSDKSIIEPLADAYLLAKGRVDYPLSPISDVLYWKYTGNRLHPTQKPVRGITRLIRAFSQPGEVVLDPFCGCGSVPLAAKILDRCYVGIELRQDYYEIAQRRLRHR